MSIAADVEKKGRVKACVLYGFGINCDYETQFALQKAGARADRVHVNDLVSGERQLDEFHLLAFPGGFSFGDDLGSGKVLANKFKFRLKGELEKFVADGKLVIGICNGFQAIVKLGLLPALGKKYFAQQATLTFNAGGKFEDRWVHLKFNPESPCIFTRGIEKIYLPVRHGEGNFVADETTIGEIMRKNLFVARYCDKQGELAGYPCNPNGSVNNIAGVCDESGRVFGIMPHPEAFNHYTNHPRWTRGEAEEYRRNGGEGPGIQLFRNGVHYAQKMFCENVLTEKTGDA